MGGCQHQKRRWRHLLLQLPPCQNPLLRNHPRSPQSSHQPHRHRFPEPKRAGQGPRAEQQVPKRPAWSWRQPSSPCCGPRSQIATNISDSAGFLNVACTIWHSGQNADCSALQVPTVGSGLGNELRKTSAAILCAIAFLSYPVWHLAQPIALRPCSNRLLCLDPDPIRAHLKLHLNCHGVGTSRDCPCVR